MFRVLILAAVIALLCSSVYALPDKKITQTKTRLGTAIAAHPLTFDSAKWMPITRVLGQNVVNITTDVTGIRKIHADKYSEAVKTKPMRLSSNTSYTLVFAGFNRVECIDTRMANAGGIVSFFGKFRFSVSGSGGFMVVPSSEIDCVSSNIFYPF